MLRSDSRVGGLIVLDLLVNRSDISTAILKFRQLADFVFHRTSGRTSGCCTTILNLFTWLISDSKYDTDRLDHMVKQVYGTTETLLGSNVFAQHHKKIAIMATRVENSELGVFTNYHGSAGNTRAPSDCRLYPEEIH